MRKLPFYLLAAGTLLFSACDKDDDTTTTGDNFQVRLTDAPGDYKAVHLDIVGVRLNTISENAGDNDAGWQDLKVNKRRYNLLDLTNGRDTVLASYGFPSGTLKQIRLILGDNNTVTLKNDSTYKLVTPSAQTAGLKIKINAEMRKDVTYVLILDFDAEKSVKDQGQGQGNQRYKLHPVMRAYAAAIAGGVQGTVEPAAARPVWVHAIQGTDTLGTAFATPENNGFFKIRGLQAGSYEVHFAPVASGFQHKMVNTSVSNDAILNMGTVTLNP